MTDAILLQCAEEAVLALKLLKPEATETLVRLLPDCGANHPRALTTAFRKEGEQLSSSEKKALGLRSNAFLSRSAAKELSATGLERALEAHEVTLLRAHFSVMRHLSHATAQHVDADYFEYETVSSQCPGCCRLESLRFQALELDPCHPIDCEREACPVMIRPRIDFVGRFVAQYGTKEEFK